MHTSFTNIYFIQSCKYSKELTKISKELHTKCCKYEKQQHEEKSQISHL